MTDGRNNIEFKTDKCAGSGVFLSQGSPGNPGLLNAITTGVGDNCFTMSRIVYVDPDGRMVDTGFTDAGFSLGENQATAGGNGIRCFSNHQLIRNDGSFFTVRLNNPNPPAGCSGVVGN